MIYSRIKNKMKGNKRQGQWPIKNLVGRQLLGLTILRKGVLSTAKQMFGVAKQIKRIQLKALDKKGAKRISKEIRI